MSCIETFKNVVEKKNSLGGKKKHWFFFFFFTSGNMPLSLKLFFPSLKKKNAGEVYIYKSKCKYNLTNRTDGCLPENWDLTTI